MVAARRRPGQATSGQGCQVRGVSSTNPFVITVCSPQVASSADPWSESPNSCTVRSWPRNAGRREPNRHASYPSRIAVGDRQGRGACAEGHGAQAVEERSFEAAASGPFDAEVMVVVVPRDLCVAAGHGGVDPHHHLGHSGGLGARAKGEIGERWPDGLGGGAEEHRRPPLLRHQGAGFVVGRVVQRDAEVVSCGPRAVCLDRGLQRLARFDRSMQHKFVLTVDTTDARTRRRRSERGP